MRTHTEWKTKQAIGAYAESAFGGILILDIAQGINEYVETCMEYNGERSNHGWNKIYYTKKGKPYIVKCNRRIHLDEFFRIH